MSYGSFGSPSVRKVSGRVMHVLCQSNSNCKISHKNRDGTAFACIREKFKCHGQKLTVMKTMKTLYYNKLMDDTAYHIISLCQFSDSGLLTLQAFRLTQSRG